MNDFREAPIQRDALRNHRRLPHVPGLRVGDIVFSQYGRRMRVESTNEYISTNAEEAIGPYCALRALDDKNCGVIWPRSWYTKPGEQMALDLRGAQ